MDWAPFGYAIMSRRYDRYCHSSACQGLEQELAVEQFACHGDDPQDQAEPKDLLSHCGIDRFVALVCCLALDSRPSTVAGSAGKSTER